MRGSRKVRFFCLRNRKKVSTSYQNRNEMRPYLPPYSGKRRTFPAPHRSRPLVVPPRVLPKRVKHRPRGGARRSWKFDKIRKCIFVTLYTSQLLVKFFLISLIFRRVFLRVVSRTLLFTPLRISSRAIPIKSDKSSSLKVSSRLSLPICSKAPW